MGTFFTFNFLKIPSGETGQLSTVHTYQQKTFLFYVQIFGKENILTVTGKNITVVIINIPNYSRNVKTEFIENWNYDGFRYLKQLRLEKVHSQDTFLFIVYFIYLSD